MSISLECPRCKNHLSVPKKSAGGYVQCPHCKGQVWVERPSANAAASEPALRAVPPPPGAVVPLPPNHSPPSVPPRAAPPGASPPLPPASARPRRKVARFISAESTPSRLQPTAEGKLPELHLSESGGKEQENSPSKPVNPLVLFGILAFSVALSLLILAVSGDSDRNANTQQCDDARLDIEKTYFDDPAVGESLREAERAHLRRDHETERELYRKVLNLLHGERGTYDKGLTGSRPRDKKLEELIGILLRSE
jgi:hypothetical protein